MSLPPSILEEYGRISQADACALAGCSQATIYRYEQEDPEFPAAEIYRGRKYFKLAEFVGWLKTRAERDDSTIREIPNAEAGRAAGRAEMAKRRLAS